MDDPHDTCDHWADGGLTPSICLDCENEIHTMGFDPFDKERCVDCASDNRREKCLSQCCNAPLQAEHIGHTERQGELYADFYTCADCGRRQDD